MAVLVYISKRRPGPLLSSLTLEVGQWSTQSDAMRQCRKFQYTQIYSSIAYTHMHTWCKLQETDTYKSSDTDSGPQGISTKHMEQPVPLLLCSLMRHRDDY